MSEEQGAGHGQPSVAHEAAARRTCSSGVCSQDPLVAVEHLMINVVQRESSTSSSPKILCPLSYSRARTCSRLSLTLLSFCRKNIVIASRATEWLVDAFDVQYEGRGLLARGINHGIWIPCGRWGRRMVVSAARSKFSMSRAPLRLKPVTSPSSSMPITSLPPAALANALMCFMISFVVLAGALFRSKYWFSFEGGEQVHIVCRYGLLHRCLLIKPLHAV